MWKGTPVIGGDVGGIRYQIEDGVSGFLVNTVEEAAARIVQLIKDKALRRRLGEAGKETVRQKFLLSRNLEQYLDLFSAFETNYTLKQVSGLEKPRNNLNRSDGSVPSSPGGLRNWIRTTFAILGLGVRWPSLPRNIRLQRAYQLENLAYPRSGRSKDQERI